MVPVSASGVASRSSKLKQIHFRVNVDYNYRYVRDCSKLFVFKLYIQTKFRKLIHKRPYPGWELPVNYPKTLLQSKNLMDTEKNKGLSIHRTCLIRIKLYTTTMSTVSNEPTAMIYLSVRVGNRFRTCPQR